MAIASRFNRRGRGKRRRTGAIGVGVDNFGGEQEWQEERGGGQEWQIEWEWENVGM